MRKISYVRTINVEIKREIIDKSKIYKYSRIRKNNLFALIKINKLINIKLYKYNYAYFKL